MNQYQHWIATNTACLSLRGFAALAALLGLAALSACSGGAATTANPVTTVAQVAAYSGPPPATADVQAFMVSLWANVKATNRCGGCHTQGGQSPQFARTDDVNLAYQAANTVVNLSQPDQSLMVQKVAGGHNCWLASPSACGDTITVWIQNWAGSTATGSQYIKLVAPPNETVGSSKTFPPSPATFQTTIYPIVTQYCSRCHSESAGTPQQPYFASADVNEAYSDAQAKIVLADANPGNANPPVPCTVTATATTCLSRFVARLATDHHNCWTDCTADAQTMLTAIENFADPIPLTVVDPTLVISKALTMYDGTVASGQNRYTTSQIALYEFKTGTGTIAYDTSGVEPELDLNLSGNYTWDAGWGCGIQPGLQGPRNDHHQPEAVQHDHQHRRVHARGVGVPGQRGPDRRQRRQLLGWPDDPQCHAVAECLLVRIQCAQQRHRHQRCPGAGYQCHRHAGAGSPAARGADL